MRIALDPHAQHSVIWLGLLFDSISVIFGAVGDIMIRMAYLEMANDTESKDQSVELPDVDIDNVLPKKVNLTLSAFNEGKKMRSGIFFSKIKQFRFFQFLGISTKSKCKDSALLSAYSISDFEKDRISNIDSNTPSTEKCGSDLVPSTLQNETASSLINPDGNVTSFQKDNPDDDTWITANTAELSTHSVNVVQNTKVEIMKRSSQIKWVIGLLFSAAFTPAFNVFAISCLPADFSGFSSLQIILVMMLSKCCFDEIIVMRRYIGGLISIAGVFLLVLCGGQDPIIVTATTTFQYLLSIQSVIFYTVTAVLLVICAPSYYENHNVRPEYATRFRKYLLPITSTLFGGISGVYVKALTILIRFHQQYDVKGIFGFLFNPLDYLVLFVLISASLGELFYLNKSLKHYSPAHVVSIMSCFLTVSGGIGGMLCFQAYPKSFSVWFVSLSLTMFGVFLMDENLSVMAFHAVKSFCFRYSQLRAIENQESNTALKFLSPSDSNCE